jgi:ABC-type nitrate/sulfonate/bicarbonate transport system permease component
MPYEEVKVRTPLALKILPPLSVLFFLGIWQGVVSFGVVPSTMLASPATVLELFIDKLSNPNPDGAVLSAHAWMSAKEAVTAYILALVIGVPLGLFMGWYTVVRGLFRPIFEMIRPIPPIAWIPLCIFWFGIGIWGKIFIIWIAGIVPFTINSWAGVNMTNPVLIQMARTYGATDWQIFTKICIPSALPMIFGALQISLAYCWTNLVAAELLAADTGLGYLISMGRRLAMPEMVILGMVSVGMGGAIIGVAVDWIEKRLLAWIRR